MYLKPLKIGNVELKNNVFLAPMAGITDRAFRIICKEHGAGLATTEMASSKAIFYNDEKTKKLLNIEDEQRPISVQIFGSDVEAMITATKYVDNFADIIDINMGCPAPKVVKNGDGSKLLLDLNLAYKIVEAVVNNTTKPVTVKIRKGWDDNNIVAKEAAILLEKAGASAITIHGRTRQEFYTGVADLDIIKSVKEAVNIPVIGNGDITSEESAKRMFEYTGVDGIMCGRGALGNPWIFEQIIYFLETGNKLEAPSLKEKLEVMKKHIKMEVEEKGENVAIKEMRKHISWYIKNLKDSSKMRDRVNQIETEKELLDTLTEYFNFISI